jgi:DHA2 family multidrug resistance protein
MAQSGGHSTGHNPWAIALTVTLATFMEVLDTSIANVALPHIAGNLSVDQTTSTWVLTSYLVSNAIVLPISGWLATRFGRKKFYMSCVALFTVSSFLCGIAPNIGLLILFRILQGAGGGGLAPSEQAILADTFEPKKRGMAFAVYGMAVVLAPAIGPTLGGVITDNFSWRWIFFLNVPVGFLSLYLSHKMVVDPPYLAVEREKAKNKGVDFMGLGLVALWVSTMQVVLDKGEQDDWWNATYLRWFMIISATSLVAFVTWEWRHPDPIVDIKMFKNRSFAISCAMMLMLGAVLFGTTVLIPQYMQTIAGYTATLAGETLSPGGLAILFLMPLIGILVSRVDTRFLVAIGFSSQAWALFYMASHLTSGISFHTAMLLRIYQAMGLAFLFVPINTVSYAGIPPEQNNQVSSLVNLMRNLGGSIGISMVTTFLARRAQVHQTFLVAHISRFDQPTQSFLNGAQAAVMHAGFSAASATQKAYGELAGIVAREAMTLAYVDTIRGFGYAAALMIPFVFLLRKPKAGAVAAH